MRCILILQYIAQTYEQYSHDEAKAFTNIKTKIAFSAEDIHDAEYISKLLGSKTVRVRSGSISTQRGQLSESQSYNYQSVPLLRPEKIMRMPNSQTLIMRTGFAPVKTEQYVWYHEKTMKGLKKPESTLPAFAHELNFTHFTMNSVALINDFVWLCNIFVYETV